MWDVNDPTAPWLQPQPSDPFASGLPDAPVENVAPPPGSPAPAGAPPALVPDAISSSDPGIAPHEQYLNNVGAVSTEHQPLNAAEDASQRAHDFAGFAPEDQSSIISEGDPQKLAQMATDKMSPEQLADISVNHQQALIDRQTQMAADAARKDREQAEANYAIQQQAYDKAAADTAAVDADAKALAARKIDDAPGAKLAIAGVLSAAITGALTRSGTPNAALQSFEHAINNHIQAQKDDIANGWQGVSSRRNSIATALQQHGDLFRAQEAYRIGMYEFAMQSVLSEAQKFDPKGSTALRRAQLHQDMAAKAAQARQAYGQQVFKNTMEAGKLELEQRQAAEAARHNKAGEGLEWSKFGLEKSKQATTSKETQVFSPQELAALHPGSPVPPVGMALKDYSGWLERGAKGEELKTKQLTNSSEERSRQLAVGELIDDKGAPVLFRSVESAEKTAGSKAAVDNGTRLIDKVLAARKKYGWSSNLMKSDEWRQMQSDFNELKLQKKNVDQLGALSESDLNLVGAALGTTDPTEARDPTSGLRNARSNMVEGFNSVLRAQTVPKSGQKLRRYEPPQLSEVPESGALIQGKTATERADGARLGIAGQALSFTSNDERALKAENQSDVTPTGLTHDDNARVLTAVHAAVKGNADAIQRLADAASANRGGVTASVLSTIRTESPEVYAEVLKRLPPEVQQQQEALFAGIPKVKLP